MADTRGILIFMLLILLEKLLWTNSKVVLSDVNVTCIVHDDCILPCSFRPTSTVVIHWYKQQIPVHSYYYHKDQFGLQNKHFSGRTSLFNPHIPQGNASLLLRRVKVQDRGRYKCYTSTRRVNQEMFVNLELKAPLQSVIMEVNDATATCVSHNIYPKPQVKWATDPPSARETLENSTIRITDHKGLFTVESRLRIVGNLSHLTYFCSFISADKTQVWTASQKNQDLTQEEGRPLSIPCTAPHRLQDFSLTWTFASTSEPRVIVRYDNRSRHTLNLWEGRAELDPDLLLRGDGSLRLSKPDDEEHSGTYTCIFSGSQSRHIVQTEVNITVAPVDLDEKSRKRSWWSTAASAAFVLFTVIVALPRCTRHRETRGASHRHNGTGFVESGLELHKDLNPSASFKTRHRSAEHNTQPAPPEARAQQPSCEGTLTPDPEADREEQTGGGNDETQGRKLEKDSLENGESELYLS